MRKRTEKVIQDFMSKLMLSLAIVDVLVSCNSCSVRGKREQLNYSVSSSSDGTGYSLWRIHVSTYKWLSEWSFHFSPWRILSCPIKFLA